MGKSENGRASKGRPRTAAPREILTVSMVDMRPSRSILNYMVQHGQLNDAFAALSDPTRRGILERLGRGEASISELADAFEMTLTGIKKHVQVLEAAGLVTTVKVGRVRLCRLGPNRLENETAWIASYRQMLEERFDHLAAFLEDDRDLETAQGR